ncbi:MAG: hypothetical protein LBR69_01780 [Endomicrobium sp.]|jgi:hypothetical protein|nr:hypothetical protein [Endomicrobium sp.]
MDKIVFFAYLTAFVLFAGCSGKESIADYKINKTGINYTTVEEETGETAPSAGSITERVH